VNLDSDSHGKSNTTVSSLLFVYVVCGPVLHILIIYYQDLLHLAAVVDTDVVLKSFIIVSTHVASETGFKQDSPNPNMDSDSLTNALFY